MKKVDDRDLFDSGRRFPWPRIDNRISDIPPRWCPFVYSAIFGLQPDREDIIYLFTMLHVAYPPPSCTLVLPSPDEVLAAYDTALNLWREVLSRDVKRAEAYWKERDVLAFDALCEVLGADPELPTETAGWEQWFGLHMWSDVHKLGVSGLTSRSPKESLTKIKSFLAMALHFVIHAYYLWDPGKEGKSEGDVWLDLGRAGAKFCIARDLGEAPPQSTRRIIHEDLMSALPRVGPKGAALYNRAATDEDRAAYNEGGDEFMAFANLPGARKGGFALLGPHAPESYGGAWAYRIKGDVMSARIEARLDPASCADELPDEIGDSGTDPLRSLEIREMRGKRDRAVAGANLSEAQRFCVERTLIEALTPVEIAEEHGDKWTASTVYNHIKNAIKKNPALAPYFPRRHKEK